jgi:hypothetical protein
MKLREKEKFLASLFVDKKPHRINDIFVKEEILRKFCEEVFENEKGVKFQGMKIFRIFKFFFEFF